MRRSTLAAIVLVVGGVFVAERPGQAHKPITSPYTFTEHVLPILRDHCGRCHSNGNVAPMSLLTYEETVPWAESMRMELIAGHMPPWGLETPSSMFRNTHQMTARDLNLLLTWAAGGTPRGADAPEPAATAPDRSWRLGTPDLQLQPSTAFTLAADVQEHIAEFTLATDNREARWIRAVDVLPATPAVVRAATVSIAAGSEGSDATAIRREQILALWLPGDDLVPLDAGAGFLLPPGAELTLRIHYKKTWQRERDVIVDRSTVGLYFSDEPASSIQALTLTAASPEGTSSSGGHSSFSRTLEDDMTLLAMYPDSDLHGVRVSVHAVRPDGSKEELIAFRPQPDWTRRYWLRRPLSLTRGTRVEVIVDTAESSLLPPGAAPTSNVEPGTLRLTLNGTVQGR